jgi:hypothetical protein
MRSEHEYEYTHKSNNLGLIQELYESDLINREL